MRIEKRDTQTRELLETIEFVNGEKVTYKLVEAELLDNYNELLQAVTSKHPTETRHQTALRYIKQSEDRSFTKSGTHK
jgi:uncharacterized membrane protein